MVKMTGGLGSGLNRAQIPLQKITSIIQQRSKVDGFITEMKASLI
jgi:hypothetical protein